MTITATEENIRDARARIQARQRSEKKMNAPPPPKKRGRPSKKQQRTQTPQAEQSENRLRDALVDRMYAKIGGNKFRKPTEYFAAQEQELSPSALFDDEDATAPDDDDAFDRDTQTAISQSLVQLMQPGTNAYTNGQGYQMFLAQQQQASEPPTAPSNSASSRSMMSPPRPLFGDGRVVISIPGRLISKPLAVDDTDADDPPPPHIERKGRRPPVRYAPRSSTAAKVSGTAINPCPSESEAKMIREELVARELRQGALIKSRREVEEMVSKDGVHFEPRKEYKRESKAEPAPRMKQVTLALPEPGRKKRKTELRAATSSDGEQERPTKRRAQKQRRDSIYSHPKKMSGKGWVMIPLSDDEDEEGPLSTGGGDGAISQNGSSDESESPTASQSTVAARPNDGDSLRCFQAESGQWLFKDSDGTQVGDEIDRYKRCKLACQKHTLATSVSGKQIKFTRAKITRAEVLGEVYPKCLPEPSEKAVTSTTTTPSGRSAPVNSNLARTRAQVAAESNTTVGFTKQNDPFPKKTTPIDPATSDNDRVKLIEDGTHDWFFKDAAGKSVRGRVVSYAPCPRPCLAHRYVQFENGEQVRVFAKGPTRAEVLGKSRPRCPAKKDMPHAPRATTGADASANYTRNAAPKPKRFGLEPASAKDPEPPPKNSGACTPPENVANRVRLFMDGEAAEDVRTYFQDRAGNRVGDFIADYAVCKPWCMNHYIVQFNSGKEVMVTMEAMTRAEVLGKVPPKCRPKPKKRATARGDADAFPPVEEMAAAPTDRFSQRAASPSATVSRSTANNAQTTVAQRVEKMKPAARAFTAPSRLAPGTYSILSPSSILPWPTPPAIRPASRTAISADNSATPSPFPTGFEADGPPIDHAGYKQVRKGVKCVRLSNGMWQPLRRGHTQGTSKRTGIKAMSMQDESTSQPRWSQEAVGASEAEESASEKDEGHSEQQSDRSDAESEEVSDPSEASNGFDERSDSSGEDSDHSMTKAEQW